MSDITRPIANIELRSPQEVFDMMVDRIGYYKVIPVGEWERITRRLEGLDHLEESGFTITFDEDYVPDDDIHNTGE